MTPRATLRLQLHEGFTFDDAAAHAGYFARLGVSHLYLSPVATAEPGSRHGYDTVDYGTLNPELGGEAGFVRLVDALRAHVSQIGDGAELEPRMRDRAKELAEGQPFELGEAFKVVQMRR